MRPLASVVIVVAAFPSVALADRVVSSVSRWNDSHTMIWTDEVVEHDDGTRETRALPGGSIDGIAMIQFESSLAGDVVLGYVREQNSSRVPLHWAGSCVFITPDANGTQDLPGDQETQILDETIQTWMTDTSSCSYLQLKREAPVTGKYVGYDGTNLVVYRHDRAGCPSSCTADEWCRPAHGSDAGECYTSGDFAVTTLFYVDKAGESDDGTILDADIEINGVNWAIATGCETTCTTMGSGQPGDLGNTLAHEIGHVMGLDHTCWYGDPSKRPNDANGNPVPFCSPISSLPSSVTEATMFPYEDPGETKKKTPEQDDINGICGVYPKAMDPHQCAPVKVDSGSGCHCTVGMSGAPPIATGLFLLGILLTGRACSRTRRR